MLKRTIVGQFKKPRGLLGALAGAVMAARPSNRQRNAWTLDLLDIEPRDRVLEIGFGPGYAVELAAARAAYVAGLDHSETMLRQARKRNADGVGEGHIDLRLGGLERLSDLQGPFNAVLSANVVQFWDDKAEAFRALAGVLAPGGRIATTFQPRAGDVSAGAARTMGARIADSVRKAGLSVVGVYELELPKAPAVCVLGRRDR